MIFSKIALAVLLICTGLVTTTRIVGVVESPRVAALFTNADGTPCKMPCLFGITPDETDPQTIRVKLEAHPLTRTLSFIEQEGNSNTFFAYIGKDTQGHTIQLRVSIQQDRRFFLEMTTNPVEWIGKEIDTTSPLIPLLLSSKSGDFLSYLGVPSQLDFNNRCYYPTYSDQRLTLSFSRFDMPLPRSSSRIHSNQPLCSILFTTNPSRVSFRDIDYRWKGFTKYTSR